MMNVFEEEMVRLAEEMSLQEGLEDYNIEWDPYNLDGTKVKVRIFEEIMDSIDFASPEEDENENGTLTDAQLREIFYTTPEEIHYSDPVHSREQRSSTRGREQKVKDTVGVICRSLTWFRNKIVDEIQQSHENADLTGLLDLQDQVNSALERADRIASTGPARESFTNTNTTTEFGHGSHRAQHGTPRSARGSQGSGSFLPSVFSAVYAVKRSSTREEISASVDNLISLCNLGVEINLETVKQMTSAGALQALLSILPKAHDWPDIESQIFKIVSMLVSYEEDWALLQRSAMVILTSLYTLQLKSQSRSRTRSLPPTMMEIDHRMDFVDTGHATFSTAPAGMESTAQQQENEYQNRLIRELVSAAVDKLSLVLSAEWSKQTNLIGNLTFLSTFSPKGPSLTFNYDHGRPTGSKRGANDPHVGEAEAILQILLNLIVFIWESVASGDAANDLMAVKAQSLRDEANLNAQHSKNSARQYSEDASSGNQQALPPSLSTDSFLRRIFGISLHQLLIGDCPVIRTIVDNSAVLCSAALANLAEVPQTRPGLVARGALKLIKSWMEIGIIMLDCARKICFEHMADATNHSHFYEAFFKLFGPTFELLANATEALMFLAGGSISGRISHNHSSGGGRDYIVGWVDAQILAEGLPEMMVKLILATHEDSLSAPPSSGRTKCVLPVVVSMNISQTLFQLCCRPQNRHRLQGITIPFVLCTIFEHAFGHINDCIGTNKANSSFYDDEDYVDTDDNEDPIFKRIFEYGTSALTASTALQSDSLMLRFGNSPRPSGGCYNYVHEAERLNASSRPVNRSGNSGSNRLSKIFATNSSDKGNNGSPLLGLLSCVASSCLGALNSFFEDESARPHYPNQKVLNQQVAVNNYYLPIPSDTTFSSFTQIPQRSFLELMCNSRLIQAILSATSHLGKSHGRLSSVRVISSLTEWPDTLKALYEGSVMDSLLVIIYETEGASQQVANGKSASNPFERDDNASSVAKGGVSGIVGRPSGVERNTSGNSSISGISSSCASAAVKGGVRSRSHSFQKLSSLGGLNENYDHTSNHFGTSSNADDEDEYRHAEIVQAETLGVCYALANLCTADSSYALRMFNSGLVTLMTKLVKNVHSEISKQALRCMHAMSKVVASQVEEPKTPNHARTGKYSELYRSLETIMDTVQNNIVLIQIEAVRTIAQLALIGEDFQDKIVDECLRSIVSLLVKPKSDRELRKAAEEVLQNLGFSAGYKDFEICGFDYQTLREWYAIQRSLKPQETSRIILKDWINRLFPDEDEIGHRVALLQETSGEFHLLNEAAAILHTNVDATSMPAYLVRENDHSKSGKSLASLAIPHLHRNLTDSLLKFWPFCMPRHNSLNWSAAAHDEDSESSNRTKSRDSPFQSQHMHRSSGTSVSGLSSTIQGTPSTLPLVSAVTYPLSATNATHNNNGGTPSAAPETYDWIDKPPAIVIHLLDLFYTSRIHQLVFMDLTSLGACLPVAAGENNFDDDTSGHGNQEMAFMIPSPHPVKAILFTSRSYPSFARVGRVLQRMLEYVDQNQLFSISFRDSDFEGEFHTTLLDVLQKCPNIVSLTFSNPRPVEEEALLGHLVGQLPSTVRFVSFKGTISKQSIETLCVMLRTQNAAFLPYGDMDDLIRVGRSRSSRDISNQNNGSSRDHQQQQQQQRKRRKERKFEVSTRGLLGLALTHLAMDSSSLQKIAELLNPRAHPLKPVVSPLTYRRTSESNISTPNTPGSHAAGNGSTPQGHAFGSGKRGSATGETVSTPANKATFSFRNSNHGIPPPDDEMMRGLKYLDMSHNDLSDAQCAMLLQEAIKGPLEGLELGGNHIHSGHKFFEVLHDFMPEKMEKHPNRIRYLGLSQNNLNASTVTKMLSILRHNSSITSLDLSANQIDGSGVINEAIQEFLQVNDGLRVLNLSYNRLTTDSYRKIQLGMLNNHTLLMLPLDGNHRAEIDRSVELVQDRLRKNRVRYKLCSSKGFIRSNSFYQTEDVFSRLTFSDYGDAANQTNGAVGGDEDEMKDDDLVVESTEATATVTAASTAIPVATVESVLAPEDPLTRKLLEMGIDGNAGAGCTDSQATSQAAEKGTMAMPPSLAIAIAVDSANQGNAQPQPLQQQQQASPVQRRRSLSQAPPAQLLPSSTVNTNMLVMPSPAKQDNIADLKRLTLEMNDASSSHYVYKANTLHVLFSAPLAGYDRQGKAHPMEVLDYASERDSLIQVFKEAHRDVALHFDFATTNTLRTLLSFNCRALHFSGHGLPNGLCFEDGRSGLQIVGPMQLKDLLGAGGLSLKFVFVSACYSKEIGEAFVRAGVPHVVCVKIDSKIQDSAAMAFTRAFYIAFLSGRSVSDSFVIAKEALKASPYVPNSVLEGEKFILLPDDNSHSHQTLSSLTAGDDAATSSTASAASTDVITIGGNHNRLRRGGLHDEVIFSGAGLLEWPQPGLCTIGPNKVDVRTFFYYNSRLPRPPTDFEGREVQMNGLVRNILDRRLVSLVGDDGIGKSAVAAAVCRYMADRELFHNAIVYVKGKGIKDFRGFLTKLKQELIFCGYTVQSLPSHQQQQLPPQVPPSMLYPSGNNSIGGSHSASNIGINVGVGASSSSSSNAAASTTGSGVLAGMEETGASAANAIPAPPLSRQQLETSLVFEEDMIFSCLRDLQLLLVFDSLDELLGDYSEAVTDLRLFFHRLFDECPFVKVLNVGVDTLMFHNINMSTANALEYSVPMGPLTISSTLRLFARLAPSLNTAQEKQDFILSLQTARQAHVSMQSREATHATLKILQLFGEGHPAKIVHMACESTPESVEKLKRDGMKIKKLAESVAGTGSFQVVDSHHGSSSAATTTTATTSSGVPSTSATANHSAPTIAGLSSTTANGSSGTTSHATHTTNATNNNTQK